MLTQEIASAAPGRQSEALAGATGRLLASALLAAAAFGLYWGSSFVLEARGATTHFGADTWYYTELARGNLFERVATDSHLDRIVRFHPLTFGMAAAWMQILAPLTAWIAPVHILKAMFAAVGAAGVWAAVSAFSAVVPRRYVVLFGALYAVSFGVWFFASIEESKIVSASLAAWYIACYLHLRRNWTARGALALTAILLLACLNEMVAGFLVVIPMVDTLLRRGVELRPLGWIAAHALAAPLAFLIIEGLIYGQLPPPTNPEGESHFGMLFYYLAKNYRDAEMAYLFVVNWLFFNVTAPTIDALHWAPPGVFEPSLGNYFSAPVRAAAATLFVAMILVSLRQAWLDRRAEASASIIAALAAYIVLRGLFFFLFDPPEPLLFSSSITLALILVIAIPFAASALPRKRALLAAAGLLLFANNGAFIIGREALQNIPVVNVLIGAEPLPDGGQSEHSDNQHRNEQRAEAQAERILEGESDGILVQLATLRRHPNASQEQENDRRHRP